MDGLSQDVHVPKGYVYADVVLSMEGEGGWVDGRSLDFDAPRTKICSATIICLNVKFYK